MTINEELTHELLAFFNGFSSWENSIVRSSEVTVSEAHALEVLGENETMNMKGLAQKLGVTTGTTTVTVDRLEKKNFARRESTKEDRRVNLISLTDIGRKAFEEHHDYHLRLTDQMTSTLSDDEIKQFLHILKKINVETF
ncbi:MarR family winged helix-turn-helix transcriptional regulator [Desulfosporosinus sp. BICA1-9]|uniref:MarR family winged helix-turn-helix transcriptional regulator n=1 Tax=Desulfosporosinus sp. BICA1-9 TaxID=1531958 RepID=UPI00054B195C|nr:MarR family transcriptional regulator [Desulfosporosinus sp. BICA1-9]KJS48982.1 MAG: MarR family transcriptional regulator [Peptococcaceae bacterium BRH_c23]KJS80189.1 MAG: MarR family transcriptional regulator [Desulfosporosinus sp. BICA1-9]